MTSQGQRDTTEEVQRLEDRMQEPVDTIGEFSRLLQSRRWEVQEAPFRGFGSPPGRF